MGLQGREKQFLQRKDVMGPVGETERGLWIRSCVVFTLDFLRVTTALRLRRRMLLEAKGETLQPNSQML